MCFCNIVIGIQAVVQIASRWRGWSVLMNRSTVAIMDVPESKFGQKYGCSEKHFKCAKSQHNSNWPNDRPEPVANRPMTHTLMDDQIDWLTGRYSSHCQRLGEKTEFLQLYQSCRAAWISPSIRHYTPAVPDANVTGPCVILQHVE
jgi:hypothetical protein